MTPEERAANEDFACRVMELFQVEQPDVDMGEVAQRRQGTNHVKANQFN